MLMLLLLLLIYCKPAAVMYFIHGAKLRPLQAHPPLLATWKGSRPCLAEAGPLQSATVPLVGGGRVKYEVVRRSFASSCRPCYAKEVPYPP